MFSKEENELITSAGPDPAGRTLQTILDSSIAVGRGSRTRLSSLSESNFWART